MEEMLLKFSCYFSINAELTVNACVQMLLDFRLYKDWMYACRWVPARFFRYNAVSLGTKEADAIAHAWRELMPKDHYDDKCSLNNLQHRAKYKELIAVSRFSQLRKLI